MSRMTKIDRMSDDDKEKAIQRFWLLPECAVFPPEVVALVCGVSLSWLQVKRCQGNGITFVKVGPRKIGYMKKDIINFFELKKSKNTL